MWLHVQVFVSTIQKNINKKINIDNKKQNSSTVGNTAEHRRTQQFNPKVFVLQTMPKIVEADAFTVQKYVCVFIPVYILAAYQYEVLANINM